MKILIAVGIILIIAAITNPKKEEHVDAVKKVVMSKAMDSAMDEISSQKSDWGVAGGALGMTLGVKAIEAMLETVISVDNYVVLSLTRATFQGKTKIIGVGAFGNVFLASAIKEG